MGTCSRLILFEYGTQNSNFERTLKKVSNENEGTVKNSEAFPDFPPEEILKNEMIFTASWGEDYVSDNDKNYFPSEDSDSDEFI